MELREEFERAHLLTDLRLTWENGRYVDDNTQRHLFTWEKAYEAGRRAQDGRQVDYEAAYRAYSKCMGVPGADLTEWLKADLRTVVDAALRPDAHEDGGER